MMLVGICGLEGSGKDSIANFLIQEYDFTRISFASVLKDVVAVLFDWDRNLLEGLTPESRAWREVADSWWSEKLGIPNFTPRMALQMIGTDVVRNHFHPDIWLLAVERQLQKYTRVVISDCRFPNELDLIRRLGGTVWRVERGVPPEWATDYLTDNVTPPIHIHPTSYLWMKCSVDVRIENNGSLTDLHNRVVSTMTHFCGKV
jgi:hypothetical protein